MENFKSSNDILDNDEKIRQRIIDDGYLYLQNFFPKKKIIEIRNRMLSIINEAGWIDTSNGKNFKEDFNFKRNHVSNYKWRQKIK